MLLFYILDFSATGYTKNKSSVSYLRLHVSWEQRCCEILVQNSHIVLFQSTPKAQGDGKMQIVCHVVPRSHFPPNRNPGSRTELGWVATFQCLGRLSLKIFILFKMLFPKFKTSPSLL